MMKHNANCQVRQESKDRFVVSCVGMQSITVSDF